MRVETTKNGIPCLQPIGGGGEIIVAVIGVDTDQRVVATKINDLSARLAGILRVRNRQRRHRDCQDAEGSHAYISLQ